MSDEEFDELWNRACQWDSPAIRTHEGDAALHDAIVFHGSVVNGGLLDAVENYARDEGYPLARVVRSYRSLGLGRTADLVERAHREHVELAALPYDQERSGRVEERVDRSYDLDDAALSAAARAAVEASPGRFAPLG
ncbi:DMP19 family protein [Kineococcus terrestris]|uniref:DMP19 family protein n=1 Tax=Kineococcus terrestris TaxID=2044856 RepID=UPI0034DB36B0